MLFIMPQPVPGGAGAEALSLSELRSLPLLLRLRESLTCRRQQQSSDVFLNHLRRSGIQKLEHDSLASVCHSTAVLFIRFFQTMGERA